MHKHTFSTGIRILVVAAACLAVSTSAAESQVGAPSQVKKKASTPSPQEAQASLSSFAGTYVAAIAQAADEVKLEAKDPQMRRAMQATKTGTLGGISNIVLDKNPYVATLDMTVVITLQRMVWEENIHEQFPVPGVERILEVQRNAEEQIWEIVQRYLTEEEADSLREMIVEWKREHPNQIYVLPVRFGDFDELRATSAKKRSSGGFLFGSISQASIAVDEARLVAEKALYLAEVLPLLMGWIAELTVYNITVNDEFQQILVDLNTLADATHTLALFADQSPITFKGSLSNLVDLLALTVRGEREMFMRDILELMLIAFALALAFLFFAVRLIRAPRAVSRDK